MQILSPNQTARRTCSLPASPFFSDGIVGHVQFGHPIEECLREIVLNVARESTSVVHDGGCYVCIEGPAFSTLAESHLYRSWGGDVVGMTNVPEAKLAREAEIAYATLALSTDYDCWRDGHDEVSVEAVLKIVRQNVAVAQDVIRGVASQLAELGTFDWPAHHALGEGGAIMTDPALISQDVRTRLLPIIGKYL